MATRISGRQPEPIPKAIRTHSEGVRTNPVLSGACLVLKKLYSSRRFYGLDFTAELNITVLTLHALFFLIQLYMPLAFFPGSDQSVC